MQIYNHLRGLKNLKMSAKGFLYPLILMALISVQTQNARGQNTSGTGSDDGPPFRDDGQLVFLKHGNNSVLKMIQIEVADKDQTREQGLMWRRHMAEDHGMLFIFEMEQPLTFWMKNTYISLDMVFADSSGNIVSIYPDAPILNEDSIPSEKPAKYVVEVNAGFCARYGIDVGDRIQFER